MATASVIFAYDTPIQTCLKLIEKHRARIVAFNPSGPSGGNPELLLEFRDRATALSLLREHSPDDSEDFLNGMIDGD